MDVGGEPPWAGMARFRPNSAVAISPQVVVAAMPEGACCGDGAAAAGRHKVKEPHYGSGPEYWNDRYTRQTFLFEWLRQHKHIADLVDEICGGVRDVSILHLGCGNSELPEKLYDAGYHNIVNTDTSSVVLEQMAARIFGVGWEGGRSFREMLACRPLNSGSSGDVTLFLRLESEEGRRMANPRDQGFVLWIL